MRRAYKLLDQTDQRPACLVLSSRRSIRIDRVLSDVVRSICGSLNRRKDHLQLSSRRHVLRQRDRQRLRAIRKTYELWLRHQANVLCLVGNEVPRGWKEQPF